MTCIMLSAHVITALLLLVIHGENNFIVESRTNLPKMSRIDVDDPTTVDPGKVLANANQNLGWTSYYY